MQNTFRQIFRFIVVGCAAAATHWAVAITCVRAAHMPPLLANIVGWIIAFVISFSGHYRWTFRQQAEQLPVALRRFFLVSAGGFIINESAYAILLHATAIPYDLLLAGILVAIAFLTFVVSRLWAFRHKAEDS